MAAHHWWQHQDNPDKDYQAAAWGQLPPVQPHFPQGPNKADNHDYRVNPQSYGASPEGEYARGNECDADKEIVERTSESGQPKTADAE